MQASFPQAPVCIPILPPLSQHALPVWLTDSACRGGRGGFWLRVPLLSLLPSTWGRPCVKAVLVEIDTDSGSRGAGKGVTGDDSGVSHMIQEAVGKTEAGQLSGSTAEVPTAPSITQPRTVVSKAPAPQAHSSQTQGRTDWPPVGVSYIP